MTIERNQNGSHLTRVRNLLPKVTAEADRIDRDRKLPSELANEIADNGFFHLLVPKSLGGAEMDWLEYLAIIEAFGQADGSTAWCVNQGNVFASRSAVMPELLAREIFTDRRSVVANGPPDRSGTRSSRRRISPDRELGFQQRLPSRELDGRHRTGQRHGQAADVSASEGGGEPGGCVAGQRSARNGQFRIRGGGPVCARPSDVRSGWSPA